MQSLNIFQQFRMIFPGKPLDYMKRATTYVLINGGIEDFVWNGLSGSFPDLSDYEPHPEVEDYLRKEWSYLQEVLPDVEEAYLSQLFLEYAGTKHLERVILDLVTERNYPKSLASLPEVIKFNVENYCQLIPYPEESFSHGNYIMTEAMKKNAVQYLTTIFKDKQTQIVSVVNKTSSLYLSYSQLRALYGERDFEVPSKLKTPQPASFIKPDYELVFEKLFIENESEVLSYVEIKRENEKKEFSLLEKQKKLEACPICCDNNSPSKILKMCSSSHVACSTCVKTATELKFFDNQVYFMCLSQKCMLYIPDTVLISVWDSARFSQLLEQRLVKKDMYPCPNCNYPNNDTNDQVTCTECNYEFCQKCRKNVHSDSDCFILEDKLCKQVEECMSNEIIRNCPKCLAPLIKEESTCNKILCNCGTYMCYVCRKILPSDPTYHHFYGQGVLPSEAVGKCPLYSNTNQLHVRNVISKGKNMLKQIIEDNPGIELGYDPLKVLPKDQSNDLPFGQN